MTEPISGKVQSPVGTISICDLYYEQPVDGCVSRAGKVTEQSSLFYENDDFVVGTALVDPGCQEHLFQSISLQNIYLKGV